MGEGDADPALAMLCRAEHARLVGLLALYVGDRNVGEDLAQETLIRLHQHWEWVRTMDSPQSWLSVVGLNLARSWWRRRYAEQRAYRRTRAIAQVTLVAEPADVMTVRAAVAQLPPRQRSALLFRFYAGLSVAETAAAMRCAEGTVKSLTHRAIGTLRGELADLDPHFEEPEDEVAPAGAEVIRSA